MTKLPFPPALLSIVLRGSAINRASAFALGKASPSSSFLPSSAATTRLPPAYFSSFYSSVATVGNERPSRGGGDAALRMASTGTAERPFKTWTFDDHCDSMDWTPAPEVALSAVASADAGAIDADLVVVGVFGPAEDEEGNGAEGKEMGPIVFEGRALELDEALGGALTDLAAENSKAFKNGASAGAASPATRIAGGGSNKARRYVLLGLGAAPKAGEDAGHAAVAKAGAAVASACHDQRGVASCDVLLPSRAIGGVGALRDVSAAFHSGLYADNRFRTGDRVELRAEDARAVRLVLGGGVPSDGGDASAPIAAGARLAGGVSLARDIVNAPHNVLNSESLAETAVRIAEGSGGSVTCEILGKEECEERGMGAFLGVARGSETEPRFIHLTYRPEDGVVKKKVGIVGKGLLFDTGGYNIKTAMMELMKGDCGGAAAVLGAARAIGDLRPPGVEAHFVVAACENMIGPNAMVPSDVLTASNGRTIEVLNTDAEGRLTLADALVFADAECGCESVIELSTLTGACMVALGQGICGVWTDDDGLAGDLADVSETTGDKSWRMPMAKEYADQLKSMVADTSNLGDRFGGAITAALFLSEFVDKKKPYAHIDIAGPAWDNKIGGTGFGVKMVTEWVRRQGE